MYTVTVDRAKRRIHFKLDGHLTDTEIATVGALLIEEAKTMGGSFDVISDISTFKPASEPATSHISATQQALEALGLRRVARVIGKSVMAKLQFQRTGRAAGVGYLVLECASVEDAHATLDLDLALTV